LSQILLGVLGAIIKWLTVGVVSDDDDDVTWPRNCFRFT